MIAFKPSIAFLLTIVCLQSGCGGSTSASAGPGAPTGIREADVAFAPFEVDPITGYHAGDIAARGCPYKIDEAKFLEAMVEKPAGSTFEPRDIRAEVTLPSGKSYLIDASGLVKTGEVVTAIDKKAFVTLLKPAGTCAP